MFVEFTLRQFGERDETTGISKNEKESLQIRRFVSVRGVVLLPKFCLTLKIDDSMVLRIVAHLILGNISSKGNLGDSGQSHAEELSIASIFMTLVTRVQAKLVRWRRGNHCS